MTWFGLWSILEVMKSLRTDDAAAVLGDLGPLAQVIAAESIDEGFHRYRKSRDRDPIGHADHSDCTKANILYDRAVAVARELVGLAGRSEIRCKLSSNKRQTIILVRDCYAIRIKRTKENRGGLSTGVVTGSVRRMKRPPPVIYPGNGLLDFPGVVVQEDSVKSRLWLTATYDLDEAEESVANATIGVELPDAFLWRVPLPVVDAGVLANLPMLIADRVREYRKRRLA
ncbi:MAG: hypothetical protein H7Y88_05390 [Phycisphaerales bacterium]|nr:hypothetical protein [Phycisphaerales bacterium]